MHKVQLFARGATLNHQVEHIDPGHQVHVRYCAINDGGPAGFQIDDESGCVRAL